MIRNKMAKWRLLAGAGMAAVMVGGSWLVGGSSGADTAEAQATGSITLSAIPNPVNTGQNFVVTITVDPATEGFTSIGFDLPVPAGVTPVSCAPVVNCNLLAGNTAFRFALLSGTPLTVNQTFTATFTAGANPGTPSFNPTGNECIGADSLTEIACPDTPLTVTIQAGQVPTNTPTSTATAIATATNTATSTATATATRTNTPTATNTSPAGPTNTAIVGGGNLTPTATTGTGATPPMPTNTPFPTNTATATNTARPTDTALPTNTQAGITNTATATRTSTATTGAGTATTAAGGTIAPLPPKTGTGGGFGGTSTVAALVLVAIGLAVSGVAATRVTRKG